MPNVHYQVSVEGPYAVPPMQRAIGTFIILNSSIILAFLFECNPQSSEPPNGNDVKE